MAAWARSLICWIRSTCSGGGGRCSSRPRRPSQLQPADSASARPADSTHAAMTARRLMHPVPFRETASLLHQTDNPPHLTATFPVGQCRFRAARDETDRSLPLSWPQEARELIIEWWKRPMADAGQSGAMANRELGG